jgi:hypothetical protein
MKLWLSKVHNGRYILTVLKPLRTKVVGHDFEDLYEHPGEPFARGNSYCEPGIQAAFGVTLDPLCSIKIEVSGASVGKQFQVPFSR